MPISLVIQQYLEKVDLVGLFNDYREEWKEMAQKAHDFIQQNFPSDYDVHPEDVSKALIPLLEVNDRLTHFLNESKLREKYWMKYFCDYILDRCWDEIHLKTKPGAKVKK